MAIRGEHIAGFVVGLGSAALGFYLYKKNQADVDAWLRSQGIQVPESSRKEPSSMTVEELMTEKERLEDIIAEREAAASEEEEAEE